MKTVKKAILLLLTLGIVIQAFPQQKKIIRGRVIDKVDKIAVIGANIIEYDKDNRIINGTISNVNGDFVLEMRNSENIVKISVIGYNSREVGINVAGPLTIEPRTAEGEDQPILKMRFDIVSTNNREANKAELAIWNLKESSRTKLQEKNLEVIIKAGYVDSISQIFKGDTQRTVIEKEAVDWIATIELGDGAKELKNARINKSFRGPQKPGAILKELADAVGLDIGNLEEQIKQDGARSVLHEFINGIALSGKWSDKMDDVASSMGLNYSIQGKKLQVLAKNGYIKNPPIDLSVQTGMIGSPQIGEKGTITAASLLDPLMVPGQRVKVDSEVVAGTFIVQKVHHIGDTWGAEWTTEVEMSPL